MQGKKEEYMTPIVHIVNVLVYPYMVEINTMTKDNSSPISTTLISGCKSSYAAEIGMFIITGYERSPSSFVFRHDIELGWN